MVPVKKNESSFQLVFTLIPFLLSLAFSLIHSVCFLVMLVLSLFVIIGAVPIFKKRENMWMFLLVAFTSIPTNIYVIYLTLSLESFENYFSFMMVLWGILLYCILLSIEEIVFGLITRIIWRKQYKFN